MIEIPSRNYCTMHGPMYMHRSEIEANWHADLQKNWLFPFPRAPLWYSPQRISKPEVEPSVLRLTTLC